MRSSAVGSIREAELGQSDGQAPVQDVEQLAVLGAPGSTERGQCGAASAAR